MGGGVILCFVELALGSRPPSFDLYLTSALRCPFPPFPLQNAPFPTCGFLSPPPHLATTSPHHPPPPFSPLSTSVMH